MAQQTREAVIPTLIPVNTESEVEAALFYHQRVACGWKFQTVPENLEQMRQNKRILLWICIPAESSDPVRLSQKGKEVLDDEKAAGLDPDTILTLPVLYEASPSTDQETNGNGPVGNGNDARGGRQGYLPVGHVALDFGDFDTRPTPLLGTLDGKITAITTLFVLSHYRQLRLGGTTMRECAARVQNGDLASLVALRETNPTSAGTTAERSKVLEAKLRNCEEIRLSAMSERHYTLPGPEGMGMWARVGRGDVGNYTKDDKARYLGTWYKGLGYEKVTEMPKYHDLTTEGESVYWWCEVWTMRIRG